MSSFPDSTGTLQLDVYGVPFGFWPSCCSDRGLGPPDVSQQMRRPVLRAAHARNRLRCGGREW